MEIRVALLPQLLPPGWNSAATIAVVIDTLRFTTTACQALFNGARDLTIAKNVAEALRLTSQTQANPRSTRALLCGERHCRPIEGFDLGNSPYEYNQERVADQNLVFTTTNGTRAIAAVESADQIWLAANVNRRAICQALRESSAKSVWIVCAGTDGEVALEDMLTAGAILDQAQGQATGDAAHLVLSAWHDVLKNGVLNNDLQSELVTRYQQAHGGRNLVQTGYAKDLDFAAQLDILSTVPRNRQHWNVFAS